jgi:DNA mismatch endonuclease, patch repair protein
MRLVPAKGSTPEMVVRRLVHSMGYRYRLHSSGLPGKPDLVFSARKKVILVHGCFWHRHSNCHLARLPKSRLDFWLPKLERNKERDKLVVRALRKLGWKTLIVWECETVSKEKLAKKLRRFLDEER